MQEESNVTSQKFKELTSSLHESEEGDPVDDPVYQETRRTVLRVGNILFAVLGFSIFIPMLVGVGQGISERKVWDPYTDEPVYAAPDGEMDCVERGRKLLQAGQLTELERSWAEPYREWQMRCRDKHLDLSEALDRTPNAQRSPQRDLSR